ncbi:MAG: hypothetical protein H6Q00_426, partial [Holophagaceae bacterium]|nr:hypothetical protein [Holophagaceae bacterium]
MSLMTTFQGGAPPFRERLAAHTLPFLAALLACTPKEAWETPLTFQVFDDREDRRDPKMARTLHGCLSALAQELDRRNRAGAGIFVTVNATDGTGRSKEHITGLRTWWTDLDLGEDAPPPGMEVIPLPPSLRVRSGHGEHLYWLAQELLPCGCAPERQRTHEGELRQIQASLKSWGADPAVCEVARVMRLPGFLNRKREPHVLVELAEACPVRYTPEEIRVAFRPEESAARLEWEPRSPVIPSRGNLSLLDRVRVYASLLAREAPAIAGSRGHATTLAVAIKVAAGFNLGEEDAFDILWHQYNPACQPPWSEEELRRKVREALRVSPGRGWLVGGRQGARPQHPEPHTPDAHRAAERTPSDGDPTRPCFPPYRLDPEGLWYLPKGKIEEDGSESPMKPQKLCGPFQVLAETRDVRWQGWGLRLQWQDPDQVAHEETLPRELFLGEGSELARTLIRGGLWVAPDETRRKKLVAYLASVRVS